MERWAMQGASAKPRARPGFISSIPGHTEARSANQFAIVKMIVRKSMKNKRESLRG
jgi:hypothetical protein